MALPPLAQHSVEPTPDAPAAPNKIRIGTRKSTLALIQTDYVVARLKEAFPSHDFEIFASNTEAGDLDKITPLRELTGKNIWTYGLENLLIAGNLDLIVHSLKDVPTNLPSACTLGAILNRDDPRDAFVVKENLPYQSLEDLPAGSVIGTSSIRRTAQLARKYPHLKVKDVRGNIGTRLSKLDADDGPFTCVILAAAGLQRLGLENRITQYLDSSMGGMLHAVGQGALGVEIRSDDKRMEDMLAKVVDTPASIACSAERALLRMLEGGCSAPLGVETSWTDSEEAGGKGSLKMRAVLVSVDGSDAIETERTEEIESGKMAEFFGIAVAEDMLSKGAGRILEEIEREKRIKEPVDLNQ